MMQEKLYNGKLDWSPYSKKVDRKYTLFEEIKKINLMHTAQLLRIRTMEMMLNSDYGHPASSLGLADLFTALYFGGILKYSPENPNMEDGNRLVVSPGHISAIVYTTLSKAGFFKDSKLNNYAKTNGLGGHLNRSSPSGVEISSGSLGQGVSTAVGTVLSLRNRNGRVFLLTSDGEQQEGQMWEAYMAIQKYNLTNLVTFVDCNGIQNSGNVSIDSTVGSIEKKLRVFDFNVVRQNGHDILGIIKTVKRLRQDIPNVIILETIPGKGVSFMENNAAWHGDLPEGEMAVQALNELYGNLGEINNLKGEL